MDSTLCRVLAESEATAASALARSMRELGNELAMSEIVPSGHLISLGPQRFVNRLLCTAMELSDTDIGATVDFFASRGLTPSIQVSSRAGLAMTETLIGHGFEVDWHRAIFAAPVSRSRFMKNDSDLTVESVNERNLDTWLDVLARGNAALTPDARDRSNEHGRAAHGVDGSIDLLASIDGRPAACGSLQAIGQIGWLGGAATLPTFRGRGLQTALLRVRIERAGLHQLDHVAATALPDGPSARNLERAGLSVIDHQTVWTSKSKRTG